MMQVPRVKICGITNSVDAEGAVDAGADLLGFVFHRRSPRAVELATATEIVRQVRRAPRHVDIVAVVVNPEPDDLRNMLASVQPDLIQFHGDESPDFCRSFRRPFLKAHRLAQPTDATRIPLYLEPPAAGYLIEALSRGAHGGTGKRLSEELITSGLVHPRGFLAGGLTPQNVSSLVLRFQPHGVDVSSALEISPGKKCPALMRAFVRAATEPKIE